jgi:hypothetical protein
MAQSEMKISEVPVKFEKFGDYLTLAISSKFTIHLEPSISYSELSETKKNLIQRIWDMEQKRKNGKLHEGAILSAISFDDKSLTGQFVPYKYFLAQTCDPSLKADLKIVPVSLSGMTFSEEGDLIVAKRAPWVTQYPDCYELAPSGGIRLPGGDLKTVDMKIQLLDELVEETGIETSEVKSVKFFTLVHDQKEDGIELCAEIRLKSGGLILSSSSEYPQIMTLAAEELPSFVDKQREKFVPLSLVLMKLKHLIN